MDQALRLAGHLLDAGRGDLAEGHLRDLLSRDPENADALSELARALLLQRRAPESVAPARAAVRLDPASTRCRRVEVWALAASGEASLAIHAARAGLEMDPSDANMRGLLAYALIVRGKSRGFRRGRWFREALSVAEAGLALDPANAECLVQRTQALACLRRGAEAARSASDLMATMPSSSAAHSVRAMALRAAGRRRDARSTAAEALRLDPTEESALWQLDRWRAPRAAARRQAARDSVALYLQGTRWRAGITTASLLLGLLAVALAIRCIWFDGGSFVAVITGVYAILPTALAGLTRHRYDALLRDLRTSGALLPREWRGARQTIACWAIMSLICVVLAIAELM